MTQPDIDTAAFSERINVSIDASIAAEAAQHDLLEGITVEEAEFCLGIVSNQALEIRAKLRQSSYAYDKDQRILELHTQKLRGTLTGTLINLLVEREMANGTDAPEARARAHSYTERIFDEYLAKRDAIDSASD